MVNKSSLSSRSKLEYLSITIPPEGLQKKSFFSINFLTLQAIKFPKL